jgi:hypothetical protein
MATHTITFDPTSGIAYGVNLVINTGSTFTDSFTVKTTSGSAFNFDGWAGSSQMAKSVSIGSSLYPAATFNVGFTSAAGGVFNISLGSTETRSLNEGRYVYDILVSSGSTVYRIASGSVLVIPGISSAP